MLAILEGESNLEQDSRDNPDELAGSSFSKSESGYLSDPAPIKNEQELEKLYKAAPNL